ncbi:lysyl-tRNA synthetase, class II [Jatrophihabitans endophyticus]|uniref:Lysine--tRNA ligase n=1 Tax=Jatrophihabitans endophyticus TaxID=1206085 RepID=A0A1M5R7R6_9ACTN|nr:lysine--tRNA ligase [Jatrophihabitans endophyticus]SHH22271.1 lysyl-tRNA synthetase, class II [Jatrophihabitans endophyticus]
MSDDPAAGEDTAADDLPEQLRVRREKYDRLVADPARAPFPVHVARTTTLAQVRAAHPDLGPGTETGVVEGVTGRVIHVRNTGKLCFAMLREDDGELQVMLSLDRVGADALAAWKADVDLGDLVFVRGEVVSSKRGELSILADEYRITAKALRPLPVAHKPLSDEMRVRQRYVDLIVRPEARTMVHTRAQVLRSLRSTLDSRRYLEVETPILQAVHGGAAARPFHTHLFAFDQEMSLRIATELYLKRCIVGGIERVYEIGPTFRNEGVDSSHSPEFTMLEAYQAYGDYDTMADLTRSLILDAARSVDLETPVTADGTEIDLAGEWRTVRVHDAVAGALGEAVDADTDVPTLRALAERAGVTLHPDWGAGEIVLELYEKLVEHTLVQPTFVRDYPVSVRPLARPHRDDPRLAEAWDLIIGGVEIAPAYSELVDPVEQRRRLVEQSMAAAKGDPEAMELDEDFLRALEYGMPPTGGMGMGVDRLIMVLTGRGIRETILFPLLKPL